MSMDVSEAVKLAADLIECKSITPNDAGCMDIISKRLKAAGFHCEKMRFGEVDNLYARIGKTAPLFVFAGHTDVVPPGPLHDWSSPPFDPEIRDGNLYGRGATDMKTAIAAMIVAAENFLANNADFNGSIGFLLTSDEEGPATEGTVKVIEALEKRNEKIDYCIVGEASSEKQVGDQIRIGRRGSLSARLVVHGKQGHVAFPHLAKNPIHMTLQALDEMVRLEWDKGNKDFPPTTFQISNIHAGTGAYNVVPGHLEVKLNLRYSTAVDAELLQQRIEDILNKYQLNFDIDWVHGAEPFISKQGKLVAAAQKTILDLTGLKAKLSTGGGTSDARFIVPTGAEVIELGVPNATAHQVNEHVSLIAAEELAGCYERILGELLG